MKARIYITTLVFLFSLVITAQEKETPPEGGTPKGFTLPKKEVITYDNGLTLVMVPYGSIPKATINITLKTGNIHEAEDQVWLTDLLGELMKEGSTGDYSVNDRLAGMGGDLNVGVGMHTSSLNTAVLAEFAPEAITTLADVLVNPKWPAEELDRLKNNMIRDVTVALSRPRSQARRDMSAQLYPDHPYGRTFPTEAQVQSYTVESIIAHYDANFGAKRTTVYVVGMFNKDEVKTAVETALGEWRDGPDEFFPVAQARTENYVQIIDRPGAPQSTIYYGLPVADPSSEDYVALDIMNSLLGGSFGSRITSNIREDKGYTYSPSSSISANYKSAIWSEVADVTTEFTGASLDEINKEIVRLQNEPPSVEELQGIQNYEGGLYILRNSTPGGIIGQLNFLDVHELDESFLVERVNNINALTPEMIQEMAKKYIRTEDMTLIVVGDKEKIKDQVEETIKGPINTEQ